jgi:ribosomal protein L37AE/L43A
MNRKDCPDCIRPSFSAMGVGEWLCPYCGLDLTDEVLRLEDGREKKDGGSGYD